MKSKYLSLVAAAMVLCFNACKKDDNSVRNQIVGKWYQNKLVLHLSNGTAVDRDTTFTAASFTKDDYFQFTSDKKAVLSQSGGYGVTGKFTSTINGVPVAGLTHYTWTVAGDTLTLDDIDRNPSTEYLTASPYQAETIVQLDATHLVLSTTYYSGQPLSLSTTSYFTKGK